MANIKITTQMRNKLVRAIVQPKYEAMAKELKAREDALNAALIEYLLPPETVAILDAAPDGFFPVSHQVYVTFPKGGHTRVSLGEERRLPYNFNRSTGLSPMNTIEVVNDALMKEHYSIESDRFDMNEDRKKEETQIRAVITSSGTAQKLRAVWPEITPYIEKICQVTIVPGLPAIILEDLNKKFNLPPTEE